MKTEHFLLKRKLNFAGRGGAGHGRGGGGRGMGEGTGKGRGLGGRGRHAARGGMGAGAGGVCVCPSCGEEVPHRRGIPCFEERCPKCGAQMIRKV